jgi:hypothetical protein
MTLALMPAGLRMTPNSARRLPLKVSYPFRPGEEAGAAASRGRGGLARGHTACHLRSTEGQRRAAEPRRGRGRGRREQGGTVLRNVISSDWNGGVTRTSTCLRRPRTRCASPCPPPARAPPPPGPALWYGLSHALLPISAGGGVVPLLPPGLQPLRPGGGGAGASQECARCTCRPIDHSAASRVMVHRARDARSRPTARTAPHCCRPQSHGGLVRAGGVGGWGRVVGGRRSGSLGAY